MSITAEQLAKLPKWAREAWENERKRERSISALRWPMETKPTKIDVLTELSGAPSGILINGWSMHAFGNSFRAELGCSSGHFHSRSNPHKTDSHHAGVLYWTRREALLAARWELCEQYAATLATLDAEIEAEPITQP